MISELQTALGRQPDSSSAARASLMVADAYERQERIDAALAAYTRVRNLYPRSPEAPAALVRMAALVVQTRERERERVAMGYLTQVAEQFPDAPEAPAALAARARIEAGEELHVHDTLLKRPVPAALITNRQLAERYPESPEAEHALWKVAELYEDLKRYELAVDALVQLGTRFPSTQLDAWWKAGELLEDRVKDEVRAREAYARVPARSRRYRDARRKLD